MSMRALINYYVKNVRNSQYFQNLTAFNLINFFTLIRIRFRNGPRNSVETPLDSSLPEKDSCSDRKSSSFRVRSNLLRSNIVGPVTFFRFSAQRGTRILVYQCSVLFLFFCSFRVCICCVNQKLFYQKYRSDRKTTRELRYDILVH